MAGVRQEEQVGITDRLLWREAQRLLGRHADADCAGRCVWCGWGWPCPPRRLAERADAASRRPWREAWTARHDLNSLNTLPSWRGDRGGPSVAVRDPRLNRRTAR